MITFRQVAEQRPDTGSGAGEPRETPADLQARGELWPEPAERRTPPRPPQPRYRRIGD